MNLDLDVWARFESVGSAECNLTVGPCRPQQIIKELIHWLGPVRMNRRLIITIAKTEAELIDRRFKQIDSQAKAEVDEVWAEMLRKLDETPGVE
jgi:hypothetical protein